MANDNGSETSEDILSVKDLRVALQEEIIAVTKAADLRIREFSDTVIAYAAGEITPEQAGDQFLRYQEKWGEALPGVHIAEGTSDKEILAAVEGHTGPYKTNAEVNSRYQKTFGAKRTSERGGR